MDQKSLQSELYSQKHLIQLEVENSDSPISEFYLAVKNTFYPNIVNLVYRIIGKISNYKMIFKSSKRVYQNKDEPNMIG